MCVGASLDFVVGIDKCDVITRGYAESGIACVGESSVCLFDDGDSSVMFFPIVAYLGRLVRCSVDDKYYFKAAERLACDAPDAPIRGKAMRRRLRTVITHIIQMPARIVKHARSIKIDIGNSNAWADTFIWLYNLICC